MFFQAPKSLSFVPQETREHSCPALWWRQKMDELPFGLSFTWRNIFFKGSVPSEWKCSTTLPYKPAQDLLAE